MPVSETIHRKAKGWYSVMRVAFRRRTYRTVRRLEIESSEKALSDIVPDLQALEHLEIRSSTVRHLDDNLPNAQTGIARTCRGTGRKLLQEHLEFPRSSIFMYK
ncbi:unnamed protein product [Calypogeia fissa]